MARSLALEIQVQGQWKKMNVVDALAIDERYGRCVECHESARGHACGRTVLLPM